mmetsp:Transcript_30248/g.56746  ORF Transcript_30248/g.56746 Transcript_30248/m.56746 type:complete len:109 (-) Transcript_30248:771-1097(-)
MQLVKMLGRLSRQGVGTPPNGPVFVIRLWNTRSIAHSVDFLLETGRSTAVQMGKQSLSKMEVLYGCVHANLLPTQLQTPFEIAPSKKEVFQVFLSLPSVSFLMLTATF